MCVCVCVIKKVYGNNTFFLYSSSTNLIVNPAYVKKNTLIIEQDCLVNGVQAVETSIVHAVV